ncbi:transcription factor GTE7-like isoform X2 [Lotus japonicus]|uniref:transcription factor GTE7-like isoform X2 n=1 Tax=Lotus japonicus TaxID=34305 RepID=UPI002589ADAC|nr:transcription factor GTE7-like isoform X2 [Lotus japonicus]
MASAVLANRNEPNWPQQHRGGATATGFMAKTPYPNSNPNPNPNPKFLNNKRTQSPSDDASSINRRSNDAVSNGYSNYATFNIASYSKKELSELKARLQSELEIVRQVKLRFEAVEFQPRPMNHNHKKPVSKKVAGTKRPFPAKDLKRSQSEVGNMMKGCGQVLQKLMKHKFGWIFNVPVDVVSLGLHDYYDIVKKPMDLGTVKSNLAKNVYATPSDFASDVRLTFNNALAYNPKGHDVYAIAEQLLVRFEELYRPLHEKFEEPVFDEELQASSWNHVEPERVIKKKENPTPLPPSAKSPEPLPVPERTSNPPLLQSPVRSSSPMQPLPQPTRMRPASKHPKPKARDPNKREMNMEEKQRLGMMLQSLPSEKLEQVVQIIRRRNGNLKQDGDEIELDIEAVDTETLWELDRFVTNWRKMESPARENVDDDAAEPPIEGKKQKKIEAAGDEDVDIGDEMPMNNEDVDIGDEMPMNNFPPVEIEKDKDVAGGHASSSSSSGSSGSDSSSSSDSDSGSSSGSDSEAENGNL